MTQAVVAKAARAKTKRFTRRQLHRLAEAQRREARLLGKVDKREARNEAKAAAKVDAALEGCSDVAAERM